MEKKTFTFNYWLRKLLFLVALLGYQLTEAQDCVVSFDDCMTEDVIIYDCDMDGMTTLAWTIPSASGSATCNAVNVTQTGGPNLGTNQALGTYAITYLAQATDQGDGSIATATCVFNVIIKSDDVDPVIDDCASIVTQEVGTSTGSTGDCAGEIPDVTGLISATDNCMIVSTVQSPTAGTAFGAAAGDTETVTVTVTDQDGNMASCDITVELVDDEDPTASNPAAINVTCFSAIPAADVAVVTDEADNCDATPTVTFVSDDITTATCDGDAATVTRTYSVTDATGNSITVTQTINVAADVTAPTASNPADIDVTCFSSIPAADVAVVTDAADNCDGAPVVAFVSDDVTTATCDGAAVTVTRTYSVTDCAGNSINVTQAINVAADVTAPTASNPADIDVTCFSTIPAADISVVDDEADNCDGDLLVAFVSDDVTSATCDGAAVTVTRTYSVTDCVGNTTNVMQTINVAADGIDPTASNPADIDVECFSDIPVPDETVVTDEADNCDGAPVVAFVSDDVTSATCDGAVVTVMRIYSVTDCAGNAINVTQTINVADVTAPTASNPADIDVECFSDIPAADINAITDEADNCDGAPVVTFVSDDVTSATCDGAAVTVTRTYNVMDCAGNSTNVTQTINVEDVTDPTASDPAAINVTCFSAIPAADVAVVTDAADNCDGAPVVAFVSDDVTSATCDGAAAIVTRTYSVTDCAGNAINVTQTINVAADVTAPTASNPADIDVECFSDIPAADVTVVMDEADNCDGAPVVAFVSDDVTSATCDGAVVTVMRTYSVTDCAGNSINVTQTINVADVTAPTASNPADIDVTCFSAIPVADIAVVTDEADNCDGAPVVAFVSDDVTSATCDGAAAIVTRMYSVTDCAGNSINVTQTINVAADAIAPTASNPADIDVECFSDIPAADVTVVMDEADNCDGAPVVAFVSDDISNVPCDGQTVFVTRTYSVTDCAGNSINVTQTINVEDVTDPTASNPVDIDVKCFSDVPAPDVTVVTDEADNCDGDIAVAFVSDDVTSATCDGTITTVTRTYSVTDCAGNTINVAQAINIEDDVAPTASNPADINVKCFSDIPAADVTVVTDEADNCDADLLVAFVSDDVTSATCDGAAVTVIRTYSVTDCAGNSINVTQTINVVDNAAPTASNPADIDVECFSDIPVPDETVVTDEADNCDGAPVVAFVSDDVTSATCDGAAVTVTRTYSVTDCAGNAINVTQTINVEDVTAPTASNPADIDVECFSDIPVPDETVVTDEADNCDGTLVVAFVSDDVTTATCDGAAVTVTRTYSVTDCAGNSTNVTQTINVEDVTDPTASNPADINVTCFSSIPASDVTVVTDAADNCDGTPAVAFVSDDVTTATCDGAAITVTRTYSVTDCAGNAINVTQTINVAADAIDPTASNPANIDVECFSDIPASDVTVVTDEADNCDGAPVVAFVSDDVTSATCDGAAVTVTRTYSVTDCAGNSINVTQAINVADVTAPTASNPADIDVECFSDIPAADVTVVTDEADNCDDAPVVAFVSDDVTSATCDGATVTVMRTYSVTDCAGNAINVTQTINVEDVTAPTASNPADIDVECFSDIPAADVTVVTDAADNCDGAPVVAFVSDDVTTATCDGAAVTVTRTYSVTDCAGNSTNVTQTINVEDVTDPTASNPADINVTCFSSIPAADVTVITDEADNCDGAPEVVFVSDDVTTATCDGAAVTVTRTYSVTDCAGNSIDVTQTINVAADVTDPTASNPADIDVECFSDIPDPDVTVVTDEADNCDGDVVVAFVSDDVTTATCDGAAVTVTRTYSVTDCAGNSINVMQTINVQDLTFPTASDPADIDVKCFSDIPTPDVTVVADEADNCDGDLVVAFVSDDVTAATCDGAVVTVTRTYRVSDCAGNAITVTQTINVADDVDPTASNPADIDVECFSDIPVPDETVVTDEADNCDGAPVVAFVSDDVTTATCDGAAVTVTRTYSVTDCAGNAINVTQTINVADITAPTASNPADIDVECFSDIPAPDETVVTDEADNCDGAPVVAFVSDDVTTATCDGAAVTVTRTYSVTDCAGNSTNVTQTINVEDVTDPTASNPADINVTCFSSIPASDITVVTDAADNCDGTPAVAFVSDDVTTAICDGAAVTVTRTYSVTDCASNAINVTQTINVAADAIDPTASNPADIDVECFSDIPAADVTVVADEADNCDGDLVVAFVSDDVTTATCDGAVVTVTRTYSVTDCAGNSINVTQAINVADVTDPTASNPADIDVECFSDIPAADVTVVTDEADNCDGALVVTFVSDDVTTATCDGTAVTVTRTYSVADCAGNSTNVTQTINVADVTDPTGSNPADIDVECFSDIPAADVTVVTDAADNCDGAPVVAFVSDDVTTATCDGAAVTVTRTYSVTDCAGNAITVTQTINVEDVTDPTASNPADIDVECFSDIPAADVTVVTDAADNCDGAPVVAFVSDDVTTATCDGAAATVTRTYSVTDCAGNAINVMQTINVADVTDPTASNPADIDVECFSDIPAADVTVVTDEADNCDSDLVVAFVSDDVTTATCDGAAVTVTRTYSVTDCAGNAITVTQTINVDDVTPPTGTTPDDVEVECMSDIPAQDVEEITDEADNCDGTVTVTVADTDNGATGHNGDPFIITRTYTLTDCKGLTTDLVQTITVEDVTDPVLAGVPANETVECDAVPAPATPTATDNCDNDVDIVLATVSTQTSDGSATDDNYTITHTWTATDDAGNDSEGVQVVTVEDTTAPAISCPGDQSVNTSTGGCDATVGWDEAAIVASLSDNCDPDVSFTFDTEGIATTNVGGTRFGTFSVGETIVTYTAIDNVGNETECSFSIMVTDGVDPTITGCPATINQGVDEDECGAVVSWTVPTASDNCPGVTMVASHNPGDVFPVGTTTVTYTATDGVGNETVCTFDVIITDDEDPTLTATTPVVLSADAACAQTIPDLTGTATTTDNCDTDVDVTQSPAAGGVIGLGTTVVTLTAMDDAGNDVTFDIDVNVVDDTNPTITCGAAPADISANAACMAAIPDLTGYATTDDNCDTDVDVTQSPAAGTMMTIGVHTVTLTATDDAGNEVTCTVDVTIIDDIAPTITCGAAPADISANATCMAAIPDLTGDATADDNCSVASVTQDPVAGTMMGIGTHTVTLTVTDGSGNESTCMVDVTIVDDTAPSITCGAAPTAIPANATCMAAIPDLTGDATATDNCDTDIVITQVPTVGTMMTVGVHTVTLTATDNEGNESTCTVDVTIIDATAPSLTCGAAPADISADGACLATIPDLTGDVNVTDNCDATLTITQDPAAGTVVTLGTHTVTLTAIDDAGNESNCMVDVKVVDGTAPSLTCGATPAAISANANCMAAIPNLISDANVDDNCDSDVAVTQSPTAGTMMTIGVHTVTLTATDDAGNASTCMVDVTIADETAPSITCGPTPAAISANATCMAAIPDLTGDATTDDNCDTDVTVTQSPTAGTMMTIGMHTVTLTATDDAGNEATCTVDVTIADETAPSITCGPTPAAISANATCMAAIPDLTGDATTDDNCDATVTVTQDPVAGTMMTIGTHIVTLTATDDAGNESTCMLDVTIVDDTNPTPVAQGVTVDLSVATITSKIVTAAEVNDGSSDNCSTTADLTLSISRDGVAFSDDLTFTCADAGDVTVTLKVVDEAGNEATTTATVTINDNTDATINAVDPLCVDADPVTLSAVTTGGTFSGTGVTGDEFDPATAGVGTHEISYTVALDGCTATATLDVVVNALPDATISVVDPLCVDADAVTLSAASTGGTFSGLGVTNGEFDPTTAGVGDHTITYVVTDNNGCSASATLDITVKPLPDATITAVVEQCLDAAPFDLVVATSGGTFTGTGITDASAGTFDPATAGVGTVTITYALTGANGCSASSTVDIKVNPRPTVNADNVSAVIGGTISLSANSPTAVSYAWEGPNGYASSEQNPTVTTDAMENDAGSYTVTATDSKGCTSSTTITVSLNTCTADAGSPQTLDCNVTNLGAVPTVGSEVGQWSVVSGDGAAEFEDVNNPATLFRGTAGETYTLQWSVTGGACGVSGAFDQVDIIFNGERVVENDQNAGVILDDTYIAGGTLTSAGTVDGTASSDDVTFKAGEQVLLKVGFTVAPGASFHALIDADACAPIAPLTSQGIAITARPLVEVGDDVVAQPKMTIRPNPFTAQSTIDLNLPEGDVVNIVIMDQTGRLVKLIAQDQWMDAGNHTLEMTGSQLPGGILYIRIVTSKTQLVKKAILIKDGIRPILRN